MSPKEVDSRARKDKILYITIDQYIKTTNPVSSQYIVEHYPLDLSSATVRNVLAELEEDGYLTHPHTSAGRIPTEEGYRYFVNHLMTEIHLLEEEKNRINAEYQKESLELEALLEKTSQVLSNVTHYTSIISVDGWGTKVFCRGTGHVVEYSDFQDLQKIKKILVTLDEKEKLLEAINRSLQKKIDVFIGHEIASYGLDSCSLVISSYKTHEGASGRMAVLGPTRMDYERVISTIEYLTDLVQKIR
jgi:transcriptional regulator of heat shock response